MEGYLWKKGHTLPTMQRRYCVLKGTMLAYYTNQDEYQRRQTPRNVLEVVNVRDWDGATPLKNYRNAFMIDYLGGTTYQCHADSKEDKNHWLSALQHALEEPNRIVQEEIEEAQRHLEDEAEAAARATREATEAVTAASRCAEASAACDAAMRENRQAHRRVDEALRTTRIRHDEATRKVTRTRRALQHARHRAHDATLLGLAEGEVLGNLGLGEGGDEDDDGASVLSSASTAGELADRVARLAAQLEVDTVEEQTYAQEIASHEAEQQRRDAALVELQDRAAAIADEGRRLREAAAASLEQAQSAKQQTRLRLSSWTATSSHLDPLAEGYLLCKHPNKPSMHRRYYVLYGNTLCWYKDVDDYTHHVEHPSGVVHVTAVGEWNGKVGGMKTFPHSFAIVTVEGKLLQCSAPMKQSAVTWETALHIGLTMPALSPHRAMAAKARRDSFDLLSSGPRPPGGIGAARRASVAHVSATETPASGRSSASHDGGEATTASPSPSIKPTTSEPDQGTATEATDDAVLLVEGYLVKKSALFPMMKKKYCVLRGLRLSIYDSHEDYAVARLRQRGDTAPHAEHEEVLVCGVSEWDGHGALLHYHHGFQIHTVRHQLVQCSASNDQEKDKWVAGIHAALLKYKHEVLSPTGREDRQLEENRAALLKDLGIDVGAGDAALSSSSPSSSLTKNDAAAEFRELLQAYYLEHNPTKAHDVPMLVERFQARERALVEHLDRIYDTALAQDPKVLDLIAHVETRRSQLARQRSSGLLSGMTDFVKMTGYLSWMGASSASFCVLAVTKLVRYPSETAYETEPFNPLDSVQILSLRDVPTSDTTFNVTCRKAPAPGETESDDRRAASPSSKASFIVALAASSKEDKTMWMAKIRSGLGFVDAHQQSSSDTGSGAHSLSPTTQEREERERFRRKLVEYYKRQNPRRIGEIDTLLHYFAGREKQLLVDLDGTYGTSISTDPEFLSVLPRPPPPASPTRNKTSALSPAIRYESYLWVKHPTLGSAFRKCYCVLRDETWSCFETSRDAHAAGTSDGGDDGARGDSDGVLQTNGPLLMDEVQNLNYLNAKLHSMRVFSLETVANGAVLLRADVDPLFQDWTRILRKAADLHQAATMTPRGPSDKHTTPDLSDDSPEWPLYKKLVEFYERHHPDRVAEVGALVVAFKGREGELLREIDRIFHSHISSDPAYTSLIPVGMDGDDCVDPSSSSAPEPILMEGYLVKRGHLVPSMKKRYCVLVDNLLTYYATHEDSRNEGVKPHGSFRVEIVSDWHGKTTTQVYEHGMELETHDGKTFFCAAYTAEDKAAWVRAFQHGMAIARSRETKAGTSPTATANEQQSDPDRIARQNQLRERFVAFYQEHNPKKLHDLDLLLSCYRGREFAMLEAMDATYGTNLTRDESLLALIPPSDAHTLALQRLEYDGPLQRATSNVESAWKHAASVYVVQRGLHLSFFATREGFKAGLEATSAELRPITVLAVKALEDRASCRFAVESTEHTWMYFQAPNMIEREHWLELLRSALDAILARSLLEEEKVFLVSQAANRGAIYQGFLVIRMDFTRALAEYRAQLETSNAAGDGGLTPTTASNPKASKSTSPSKTSTSASGELRECFVVLRAPSELVLYEDANHEHPLATFTVLSTRAASSLPSTSSLSGTTAAGTETKSPTAFGSRFPFEIVTEEQVNLSCGAATDLERAKWIQQIRVSAQQRAAMALLDEQLHDVEERGNPGDGIDEAEAEELSVPTRIERRGSVLDEASGQVRGYLFYCVEGDGGPEAREGYFVVDTRGDTVLFADEAAYIRREASLLRATAIELCTQAPPLSPTSPPSKTSSGHWAKFFRGHGGGPETNPTGDQLAFQIVFEVVLADTPDTKANANQPPAATRSVTFFPATKEERELWLAAFQCGIDLRKGEQLLRDEKTIMAMEAAKSAPRDDDQAALAAGDGEEKAPMASPQWVSGHAAMEGFLTPWRSSLISSSAHPGAAFFGVLVGCRLRGFPSRDVAHAALGTPSGSSDARGDAEIPAAVDLEVLGVSDWDCPTADGGPGSGFAIDVRVLRADDSRVSTGGPATRATWHLTAPSAPTKRDWVHAVKHELDFALAETYLDDEAREFARLAAAHLATVGAAVQQRAGGRCPKRKEDYLRVRHQAVGSVWRERFAVAIDAVLYLFKDGGDAVAEDWERRAIERHPLLSVEAWTNPASRQQHTPQHQQLHRHGLRLENEDGAMLECTFPSEAERNAWLEMLSGAVRAAWEDDRSDASSTRVVIRDPSLPFVPGAAMEGYLKVREVHEGRRGLSAGDKRWRTRYGVLIGTQWLLYETQAEAIALHGHNQQQDPTATATSVASSPTDALPQAVYEVMHAEVWHPRPDAAPTTSLKATLWGGPAEEEDMDVHAFAVLVNKTSVLESAMGDDPRKALTPPTAAALECKVHTSLERKRWLNAMEDQVAKVQAEQELVTKAIKQRDDHEAAKDAVRTKLQAIHDDNAQQSARLQGILESMALDAEGSSSSSSDEDDEDEVVEEANDPRSAFGRYTPPSLDGTLHRRPSVSAETRSPERSPEIRQELARQASEGRDGTGAFGFGSPPSSPSKSRGREASAGPWWSWQAVFSCCFNRPEAGKAANAAVAPILSSQYRYVHYHADKPTTIDLDDF